MNVLESCQMEESNSEKVKLKLNISTKEGAYLHLFSFILFYDIVL